MNDNKITVMEMIDIRIAIQSDIDNCNRLIEEDKIFGCGKPFKINRDIINNKIVYRVEICDYI